MRMVGLIVAVLCASPASELAAAVADCASMPPTERPFVRYLTTFAIADEHQAASGKVLSYWCNCLSTSRRIREPIAVSDTLWRVDLRDYGWDAKAWEELTVATADPYFRDVSLPTETQTLYSMTGSLGAILRADYFVAETSSGPAYRAFLGLPDTIAATQSKFRIRLDDAKALSLEIGGSKLVSPVALHNRRLVRFPTLTGYWWQSEDHLSSAGRKSVLDFLTDSEADGGEFIWSLPNGLQAYAVSNAEGKVLDVVPADIAQDYQTRFKDKQIYTGRSCVICHSEGIKSFRDDIAEMVRGGIVSLQSYDKAKANRLEEFFLTEKPFDADQQLYAKAVREATGWDTDTFAKEFERLTYDYLERPVNAAQASRELGVSVDGLKTALVEYGKKLVASGTMAALLAGQTISREAWAGAYPDVALILRAKGVGQ